MSGKRKGKEVATAEGGAGRKKPTTNHGIDFKDANQRNRYKALLSKPIHPCRYADSNAMITLGIRDNVVRLFNTIGWGELMKPQRGYENFTYEFLSSLVFTKDKSKTNTPNHRVAFRLLGADYEMSLGQFCAEMDLPNEGYIHDSHDENLRPADYDPLAFWKAITGVEQYNAQSNKASRIHNPVLRYIQRVMGCTIFGRKEPGPTRTDELFLLWAMLNNRQVNTSFYMLNHLASVANKKGGEIVVGGIITYIAEKFGVGEEHGINKTEGNNKLNIETLISMSFFEDLHNGTYRLKIYGANSALILPNPPRTETGVAGNLLYFDEQVQEEHGDASDDEEEADHEEPVLQAGPQFVDDRWAWMQTEVQKIHTEQNRMNNEMIGMRADIQRGNRIEEENNRLILDMMQRLGFQPPPQ